MNSSGVLTRRRFAQLAGVATGALVSPSVVRSAASPDVVIEIAPYTLEASPKHQIRTTAYNGQIPGPLIRLREGVPVSVEIGNRTSDAEIVHWHGMYLPSEIDGAMEEGTPMIAPGESTRYTMKPTPAGFRWYHTHTYAGKNLSKAQYSGLHGFVLIEPRENAGAYDREVFLALHDWNGRFMGGNDGFMAPVYEVSTINGKMRGFGEPIRVKQGERVMMHILNSSPTEVHWVSCSGHDFKVVALDGNEVPRKQTVSMLRLAPAERVSAIVEMSNPGIWVLGEVRKHIQAAGMGIVLEYAHDGRTGTSRKPVWLQPEQLEWSYRQFAMVNEAADRTGAENEVRPIDLVFDSQFQGHGREELWRINGFGYPDNSSGPSAIKLTSGKRYRLVMKNKSKDDHPMHLHRHTFEVRRSEDSGDVAGLRKDVVLVPGEATVEVEFVADNPGATLFHCHQQDHMDRGFMMVFHYA